MMAALYRAAGRSGTCVRGRLATVLPVQALGAAYLGGTRLGPMAAAGLVAELRPGALALPVGRAVLGPGALVPDDVLSADPPGARRSRSAAGPVAVKPASSASMSSLRRPGRAALSTGWVWPNGRAHHKGPPR